jgi:hypothetical protein
MVEELRLYPWSPAARSGGRCPGGPAATDKQDLERGFSTAFAQRQRLRCTAAFAIVHSAGGGGEREVMG